MTMCEVDNSPKEKTDFAQHHFFILHFLLEITKYYIIYLFIL